MIPPIEHPDRCHARVIHGTAWHAHQCSRKAVNIEYDPLVGPDGAFGWCTQHTPSLVKARRDKVTAEYYKKVDRDHDLRQTERWLIMAVLEYNGSDLPMALVNAVNAYRKVRA